MANSVNKEEILEGLKALPIHGNPMILTHSSLKSFGHVEGGTQAVIGALRELCGEKGTLVMPTLSFRSVDESLPIFDVKNTPSDCGLITEAFRKLPDAQRSMHVVSSAAAAGLLANAVTSCHNDTPCGPQSPYYKVIENDGYVLFLGAPFSTNTLFHAAEEAVNPAYMRYKTIENAKVLLADGTESIRSFRRYDCWQTGVIRRLERMEQVFEQKGVLHRTVIGNCRVTMIKAADDFEISCGILKNNPDFILDKSR